MKAEIAYYRAHLWMGRDAAGLAELRRACAEVLRDALGAAGARARRADRGAAGRDPLRAVPRRGAGAAGAAGGGRAPRRGVQLGRLAARAARRDRAGAAARRRALLGRGRRAKPDPEIFARALALAGATAGEALHVGDDVEADVGGAQRGGADAGADRPRRLARRAAGRAPDRLARRAAGALCVEWIRSDDERSASRAPGSLHTHPEVPDGHRARPSGREPPGSLAAGARCGRRWRRCCARSSSRRSPTC